MLDSLAPFHVGDVIVFFSVTRCKEGAVTFRYGYFIYLEKRVRIISFGGGVEQKAVSGFKLKAFVLAWLCYPAVGQLVCLDVMQFSVCVHACVYSLLAWECLRL